jgi:chromosome partitioning protein
MGANDLAEVGRMGQLPGSVPDFAGQFTQPSIQRMLDGLSDHEFEHFVAYVFEQAGYVVEDTAGHRGPGLDLKLYTGSVAPGNLRAGVQVKHYRQDRPITAPEVGQLRNGIAQNGGVPGYFVTTSSFVGPALTQAQEAPRIWPMDGARFLRYIAYVRDTRAFLPPAPQDELSLLDASPVPIPPEAIIMAETVARRPAQTTKVLTLANHKGGVGKTTTALNLAFGLAGSEHQQQVLLVDMDTQANLTRELSSQPIQNGTPTHLGDYFAQRRTLAALVRPVHPTRYPGVWLIPSHQDLVLADRGVTAGPGAELRFVRDLHAANVAPPHVQNAKPFDWIIIDTGPSMGFFTRLALAASHYVLMPVSPGYFAEAGVKLLKRTIAAMSALTGTDIELLGGVVTQWRDDALNRQFLQEIERRLRVVGQKIPIDRNIERAHLEVGQGRGKSLFNRPKSPATLAYRALIEEIAH